MLTLITCPTCHHKFTVPESSMGQRRTCPNCESIFVAGKSVAETDGRIGGDRRGLLQRAADEAQSSKPAIDKTMLGEVATTIRYNCPRCKKPLEAPASEAGTKKPCPACGGRLQVPAAPASPVQDPLNKTLLAEAIPNPPMASPSPAAVEPATPAGADKPSVPESPSWKKYAAGAALALLLLLAGLYFLGKHQADREYEKILALHKQEHDRLLQAQKQELDKLKAEIDQKSALLKQQQDFADKQRRDWEEQKAKQDARQRELEREREIELRKLAALNDEKLAAEARAKLEQKQRELDEERKAAAEQRLKAEKEMRDQIEALRQQVQKANQKSTTIIHQPPPPPPPPPVYPWWYYRGWYPW